MSADAYKHLARGLDLLPGGFPRTESGVEVRLLERIFTPEEASLAGNLTGTSQTAEAIADQANLPTEGLEDSLFAMLAKGIIWGSSRDGVWRFRLAPLIVGFYEAQLDVMDHEMAHLFEQYLNEGGAAGIMGPDPALHRVVPARQAVKTEYILPYDDIKPLLLQSKWFELRDCICRKEQDLVGKRKCDFPVRICLNFSATEMPAGQYTITQEEALKALERAEEVGLVHTVSNVARGLYYVCNCCGCCCPFLRGITEFGLENSVAKANYHAVVDLDQCNLCGLCEERCQVKAFSVTDVPAIDLAKCIGCGLCVTGCPMEAVTLELKPDADIMPPPDDYKEWELQRLRNRGLLK